MRRLNFTPWITHGSAYAVLLLAVACGGNSANDGSGGVAGTSAAGSGGVTSGGSGNTAGEAGTAGIGAAAGSSSGGAGGEGASAGGGVGGGAGAGTGGTGGQAMECVEQMGTGGFTQPGCDDLDRLRVSNPRLEPSEGIISGTAGTFRVDLSDISGFGMNYYPGVDFESDTPGVSVTDEQFFAVLPCGTNQADSSVQVDSSVPAGTEVTLTARVMMLNQQCTGTDSLTYKFTVQLAP